jgi:hypothetical protein
MVYLGKLGNNVSLGPAGVSSYVLCGIRPDWRQDTPRLRGRSGRRRQSVLCIEEEGAWIVGCDSNAVKHIAKLASLPSSGCVKWIGVGVGRTGRTSVRC